MGETGTASAPTERPRPTPDVLKEVLKAYLETYRHHFDLFIKGAAGFLVSVGFVAGLLCGSSAEKPIKAALATAVCGGSVIALIASFTSLYWVQRLQRVVDQISDLGVGRFPFIGAKFVTFLLAVLALTLLSLAYSIRKLYVG